MQKTNRSFLSPVRDRAIAYLEKGWCQHSFACDDQGQPVPMGSSKARSWDLPGAVCKAIEELSATDLDFPEPIRYGEWFLRRWCEANGAHGFDMDEDAVSEFNDHPDTTQATVIASLRKVMPHDRHSSRCVV